MRQGTFVLSAALLAAGCQNAQNAGEHSKAGASGIPTAHAFLAAANRWLVTAGT
jgi:hypothetical protein